MKCLCGFIIDKRQGQQGSAYKSIRKIGNGLVTLKNRYQCADLSGREYSILFAIMATQQNSYSISHLLGIVTTQSLDSDGVVTAVIVGFFIFVSTCILERVFSHLEGMCSDCK